MTGRCLPLTRLALAQRQGRGETVENRHLAIHQDEIDRLGRQQIERLLPVSPLR